MNRDLVHFACESLAYTVALALYHRERRRAGDFLPEIARNWLLVAAVLGAAAGSFLLTGFHGKTIVGALLGGTAAVEWTKRRLGIVRRTGDLFALPLVLGMALGRVGCFLDGLADHTCGLPTALPWGYDFGDGIPRHPAQLYELLFLVLLGGALCRLRRLPRREGLRFRAFLVAYLAFRLAIDFLKPDPRFWGMSAIQWACLLALCWYARDRAWLIASAPTSSTISPSPSAPPVSAK